VVPFRAFLLFSDVLSKADRYALDLQKYYRMR